MKKIIAILSLVLFFLLVVLLAVHEFAGSSYAKHIKNKDIENITCVYQEKSHTESGIIPKENYDELISILEPMRYKIWFGKVKSALVDYLEIEFTNGKTIILSRVYIKSSKSFMYAWDSTYDINEIKPLIDESTITIIN